MLRVQPFQSTVNCTRRGIETIVDGAVEAAINATRRGSTGTNPPKLALTAEEQLKLFLANNRGNKVLSTKMMDKFNHLVRLVNIEEGSVTKSINKQ